MGIAHSSSAAPISSQLRSNDVPSDKNNDAVALQNISSQADQVEKGHATGDRANGSFTAMASARTPIPTPISTPLSSRFPTGRIPSWATRAYRARHPQPNFIFRALQTPFSSHPRIFSPGWIADKTVSSIIVALRAVAPLAHIYLFYWLVWPALRSYIPLIRNIKPMAPRLLFSTLLGILRRLPDGLRAYISTTVFPTRASFASFTSITLFIIRAVAIAEVLFYLYYRFRLASLNRRSPPEDLPPTAAMRRAHIRRLLSHVIESGRSPVDYVRDWFHGAPFHEIKHQNLREWMAASFFNKVT